MNKAEWLDTAAMSGLALAYAAAVALLGMNGWFWYLTAATIITSLAWHLSDPKKAWYAQSEEKEELPDEARTP